MVKMTRKVANSTLSDSKNALKSKRIVYQMSRELQKTDVNDDFQNALQAIQMDKTEKKAGFNGFLRLQNQIKDSLKTHMATGSQEGLLALLTARQMRSVTQMLNHRNHSLSSGGEEEDGRQQQRHYPETVVAKRIQVVEDEVPEAPGGIQAGMPNIPKLDVADLNVNYDDPEDEQYLEWVSSAPGRSSSRIPDLPMEPEPAPEPTPKPILQVHYPVAKIPQRIPSKPRRIQKSDAQIQTDDVEEEIEQVSARGVDFEKEVEKEKVDTVDIGLTCRLLISPRVEEHVDPAYPDGNRSQILSPISTITDISEGEVTGMNATGSHVTIVRSDGSIVFPGNGPPRVPVRDDDERYFGESETDLLRATSSSPLRVVEVDMSVSSTPTRSQC